MDKVKQAYLGIHQEPSIDVFLRESYDFLYGTDDVSLDQLIEETLIDHVVVGPEVIFEELTDTEKYKADRMRGTGHGFYMDQFLAQHPKAQYAFKYSNGRFRIPLNLNVESTVPHTAVKNHLVTHGYSVTPESYKDGIASKTIKVGNPEKGIPIQQKVVSKKIGAILGETNAHPSIKKAFENDPARTGVKTQNYDMILTHHPHDIYGMSTGRGWTSCAQMRPNEKGYGTGQAGKLIPEEINNHTHVAYLVPKGGDVDKDAVARLAFKHFKTLDSSHSTLFPESRVYGDAPNDFHKKASEAVSNLFERKEGKVYKKNSSVYDDSSNHFEFHGTPDAQTLDATWASLKKSDGDRPKTQIMQYIEPGQKYKSKTLRSLSNHLSDAISHGKSGNFMSGFDTIKKMNDEIPSHADHALIGLDTHFDKAIDAVAASFDPSNEDHVNKIKNYRKNSIYSSSHMADSLSNRAVNRHLEAPIKTVDDYMKIKNLHDALSTPTLQQKKMVLHPKHQLGANPIQKIARHLGETGALNEESFHQAWVHMSPHTNKRGNYYDHAADTLKNDVPGASKLINEVAHKMDYGNGKRHDDNSHLAKPMFYSKPETRKIFGDALGVDHQKIMKENGPALRKKDNELKAFRDELKARIASSNGVGT